MPLTRCTKPESGKLGRAGAAGRAPANKSSKTHKTSSNQGREGSADVSVPKVIGSYGVNEGASVYAPGWVGNVGVDMLLDTGSAVTLIHKRLLDRVDKGKRMSEAKERVISANGQPLGILGTCKVRIRLGGIDTYHEVLVANDITQDCLIGVDFLAKYNCLINFEDGSVKVGNRDVAMGCRSEEGVTCGRVSLAETVTVPGGHEMFMSANVGAVSDNVTGMIEPCPGFVSKHSILVARIVAKPRDNQVPVRLLNPSPDPVIIHQNTTLGTFTIVDVERSIKPNAEVFQVKSVRGKHKSSKSSKTKLTQLFNWEGSDIDSSQKSQLEELLSDFEDVVSKGSSDLEEEQTRLDIVFLRVMQLRSSSLQGEFLSIKRTRWKRT